MGALPQRTTIIGRYALPDSTPASQTGTANAVNTITLAVVPNQAYHVTAFNVVINGAASASAITVTITDGATVVWTEIIPASAAIGTGVSRLFGFPLVGTPGNALALSATAGGAGCVTIANLAYFPE